jgi:hypothetical protein
MALITRTTATPTAGYGPPVAPPALATLIHRREEVEDDSELATYEHGLPPTNEPDRMRYGSAVVPGRSGIEKRRSRSRL